jgi:predicted nucleic acid-binding protein
MTISDAFVDTNVWLYAFIQGKDPIKTQKAKATLASITTIFTNPQVINEVCINLIRKEKFPETDIRDVIDDFYTLHHVINVTQAQQIQASHLRERYQFAFWDSLLVASALASGTHIYYSEDMHNGLRVNNQLTIVNPFI